MVNSGLFTQKVKTLPPMRKRRNRLPNKWRRLGKIKTNNLTLTAAIMPKTRPSVLYQASFGASSISWCLPYDSIPSRFPSKKLKQWQIK